MKHYPHPSPSASRPTGPRPPRRIPAFHPVPVGNRADGWTPARQAAFIGMLAQTRSVLAAAQSVRMGRESVYRLRRRAGATGFAAAWDAALGKSHTPVNLASAKSTGLSARYRAEAGLAQVVMSAGRYMATRWKPDHNALLQLLAQLDRAVLATERER
ncbi:hypothetical protein D6858_01000 [Tsuneonella suprasediminis]|uniref:Uncharacterized protein n=1 Tax=Tsuneonella suprasediminis TaxID=2306996 RepID=A0A419R6C5_9SPHN|nr:hypothetical protein [Tsuneonella suprasediminis]RJX71240.1 hypothetical protein D6858_01000 [Tsuneonella suprasediminis]